MAAFSCPQCGAIVDVEAKVLATTCAFCEGALVVSNHASEPIDRVAPFVVTRAQAAAKLRVFLKGQWMAPESVRHAAQADALDAVLVPFYAFDATARTSFSCSVGVHWYREEKYKKASNGRIQERTRKVKETEWFPLSGTHGRTWLDHLVSASRGLPEAEANALEPFDLGQALPFRAALTAGLIAEHPTVPHDEAYRLAITELATRERRAIEAGHLPGDTHRNLESQTTSELQKPQLLLLPVWIAAVAGGAGPVRLVVNGQTGEVVGRVPSSRWKVYSLYAVVMALVWGVLLAIALVVGLAWLRGSS